jgi:uncharacterized protein (TIGR02466 family)
VDRFSLFSTPLYVYDMLQMEAVNHELTQRLLAESEASPGLQRSNRGGWHSAPDLGQRSEACYRTVMQMIIDHVAATIHDLAAAMRMPAPPPFRYSAQAWAMVMRDGDYTIVHDHGTAHWSVSYYVDAGDADVENHPESGLFAVLDPRRYIRPIPGLDDFSMTQFTVRPRSGRLVIFPGWLQHYVHPYRGTRPRIAIACNVSVALELLNPSPTLG